MIYYKRHSEDSLKNEFISNFKERRYNVSAALKEFKEKDYTSERAEFYSNLIDYGEDHIEYQI